MSPGLSFSLHLLALLSSVLISLPGRVLTQGGRKRFSSSRLLFLPAQRFQWEESFSFPISPEKVLKLASLGPAFSCAQTWLNPFGLGGILCDLDHAHPWSKKWGNLHLNSPDWYWRRDSPQRKIWVLLLKNEKKRQAGKTRGAHISLWLNHCGILTTSFVVIDVLSWACRIEQALLSLINSDGLSYMACWSFSNRPVGGRDSGSIGTWLEFWSPQGAWAVALKDGEVGQGAWQKAGF